MNADEVARDFVDPKWSTTNLDTCFGRRQVADTLRATAPMLQGRLLDIGCGDMPYRSMLRDLAPAITAYVGVDLPVTTYGRPDIAWDGLGLPVASKSVDSAIATEVLEHCPDPAVVLGEIRRVLRPGGLLLFTVPFLWPLHVVPHDEYRYTPFALSRLLEAAGFTDIHLEALGGWDASLAQMIGLWVRRRPMRPSFRRALSAAALPLVRALTRTDRPPAGEFPEGTMLSAIAGTARS